MSLADSAEQRKHPKVEARWPVTMETPEGKLVGKTENISCGGAYIRCSMLLSKNDFLTMTIQAPNREPLYAGAEGMWVDIPLIREEEQVPIGIGARFTHISVGDLQSISNVVSAVTKD